MELENQLTYYLSMFHLKTIQSCSFLRFQYHNTYSDTNKTINKLIKMTENNLELNLLKEEANAWRFT